MPRYIVKIEVKGTKTFDIIAANEDMAEEVALERVEWDVPEKVEVYSIDIEEKK